MSKKLYSQFKYQNRTICLPFDKENYYDIVFDANKFRASLNKFIEQYPELFPNEIAQGYQLKDVRFPTKLPVPHQSILVKETNTSYTIRPSFVMPYLTFIPEDVERVLFLRKYNVPFHALSYVFGENAMKWFRMSQNIGRNSIVSTTIKYATDLPQHVIADEKHTWIMGEKAYIATTCANNCILGASIVKNADETELTKAYGVFKQEAIDVEPNYAPLTITSDGWQATQNAWKTLFSSILLIRCFLHIFIKIRDRTKNKFKDIFIEISEKLWNCFKSADKRTYSQRVRRLIEWASIDSVPSFISPILEKLRENADFFTPAYDFPKAPRTTNMVDRLMRPMDKYLFTSQYFQGSLETAELSIRSWVLIQNFAPSNPYTIKKFNGLQSPVERLNQSRYHENWLQNLLVSASQRRHFNCPQNPL